MNNYEELKMSVIVFDQEEIMTDIIASSPADNSSGTPGNWEN